MCWTAELFIYGDWQYLSVTGLISITEAGALLNSRSHNVIMKRLRTITGTINKYAVVF